MIRKSVSLWYNCKGVGKSEEVTHSQAGGESCTSSTTFQVSPLQL